MGFLAFRGQVSVLQSQIFIFAICYYTKLACYYKGGLTKPLEGIGIEQIPMPMPEADIEDQMAAKDDKQESGGVTCS